MAPIQHVAPPAGLKAPPLSYAARTDDLHFVSGIPGFDEKGILPDNFEAQFGFVVSTVKRILDEAGGTFRDLVKVNVLLTRVRRRHDECVICFRFRAGALSRPHHMRRSGPSRSRHADRNRVRRVACKRLTGSQPRASGLREARLGVRVVRYDLRPIQKSRLVCHSANQNCT